MAIDNIGLPSGKSLHNYGKPPCSIWVNQLFLWPFSSSQTLSLPEGNHQIWVSYWIILGIMGINYYLWGLWGFPTRYGGTSIAGWFGNNTLHSFIILPSKKLDWWIIPTPFLQSQPLFLEKTYGWTSSMSMKLFGKFTGKWGTLSFRGFPRPTSPAPRTAAAAPDAPPLGPGRRPPHRPRRGTRGSPEPRATPFFSEENGREYTESCYG